MLKDSTTGVIVRKQIVFATIPWDNPFHVSLSLGILFLHEQYPCVGVQVCAIVWLQLYGAITHFFCLAEVLVQQGKEVGIIVEAQDVVLVVH